jgi:hypothetical protein
MTTLDMMACIHASVDEAKGFKDRPMFIKVTESDSSIYLLIYSLLPFLYIGLLMTK